MKAYDAIITKENIQNYFKQSGLTMGAFANLLGISKRWLEYLFSENENYEFTPNTVQKACDFFITDFRKFTTELQEAPFDLREILKKKHAKNTEYSKILSDAPSVPFIIEKILVKDEEFVNSSRLELRFIKRIIWKYHPELMLTNLSSDLQKSEFVVCEPHPTKANTNVYRKK